MPPPHLHASPRPNRRSGRFFLLPVLIVLVVAAWGGRTAQAQRFLPDDPVWEDPDRMDIPYVPSTRDGDASFEPFDFLSKTFGQPGSYDGSALNVNTLGEVPNSSWYTNRHYHDRLTPDALQSGPNDAGPPSVASPWTVVSIDRASGLPQAEVVDDRGRRYHLVVDPKAHPEMATGAAMIGSRLAHALGYNVPEHYLMTIAPSQVRIDTAATVTRDALWKLFNFAPTTPDARYRVLLTRIPDASQTLGPFSFYGTRPDDPNDIFPHEARRELRGLEVVAAWLQHSRIRRPHTIDALIRDGDRMYVRHYLTDFFLTLGSAGAEPKPRWSGHEHILDVGNVMARIGTLGLSGGEWMNVAVPDYPGVGYLHAVGFSPEKWRPEYPNPAFERATDADRFWAARQVAHFTRADIRAVVETADYTDIRTADYLVDVLVARRDAIAKAYLDVGGGLDRFNVSAGALEFDDLRLRHALVRTPPQRRVTWQVFANETETVGRVLKEAVTDRRRLTLPDERTPFLRVEIRTPGVGRTYVYLRRGDAGYAVVGLKRTTDE